MNTAKIFSLLTVTAVSLMAALPAFAQPARLSGAEPGSRINVRSAPSTQASSPHYGLVGDRVETLQATQGDDGYTWYYIKFGSGAQGWVRGDFVSVSNYSDLTGVLSSSSGGRINVRSAPSTQAASPHYGVEGDRVQVLKKTRVEDGALWYFVRFDSGAEGWVRGDLIQVYSQGE
jgi:uncharacterized protein YgiM (DUF1202 family)